MKLFASLAALMASVTALLHGSSQTGPVVAPERPVQAISQAAWADAWWQWAGSFDRDDSPVADRRGDKCHLKQSGPVWFLAGTYGTHRTIRRCRVPHGKYLFFPLINYVMMPRADGTSRCANLAAGAKQLTDAASLLVLDIDGHRVPDLARYRQASEHCFDMGTRMQPRYRVYPSAANGYYVMLRPLERGTHVLNFGGALPSMRQAVTYTLIVE